MYRLVKDFVKTKIVFYWIDQGDKRVSPPLPSLQHAKEWLIDRYFISYDGPERRRARVDRRLLGKKNDHSKRNPHTQGRRITDRPIKVDLNLAEKKIAKLIESDGFESGEPS